MADDVVALLDKLRIDKADVVGWSDGATLGLDLAIRHPDRVGKVFAFAANTVTSGVQEGVEKNPTFARFIERAGHEYARLSATPKEYDAFVAQISKMWETEPNWTDAQLQSIRINLTHCPHARARGARRLQRALTQTDRLAPALRLLVDVALSF